MPCQLVRPYFANYLVVRSVIFSMFVFSMFFRPRLIIIISSSVGFGSYKKNISSKDPSYPVEIVSCLTRLYVFTRISIDDRGFSGNCA